MIKAIDRVTSLQNFVESLSDPALIIDNHGSIICENRAATDILALSLIYQGDAVKCMNEVLLDADFELTFPLDEVDTQKIEIAMPNSDLIKSLTLSTFFDNANHIVLIRTNAQLTSEDNFLQLVLESIPARVFWKDLDSTFLGCNSKFAKDAGVSGIDEIIGKKDQEIFPSEGHLYVQDDLEVMHSGRSKINIEEPQTLANGEEIWISTNKVPIRDNSGNVVGIMGSYADITARVHHQQLMERQARSDHLTALPNRLALQEKLLTLDQSNESIQGGLLYIDLDYFKTVNDTLGHDVGDKLLIEVAHRITVAVSDRGFIARLGGDEFSVLVQSDSYYSVQETDKFLFEIANEIKSSLLKIFEIELNSIRLGVSIGIANFGYARKPGIEQLVEADIAMYEAKCAGRNLVLRYDGEMRRKSDRLSRLKSCLSTACENEEFEFMIQPQFDQHSNWIGGELLTRWNSPTLGQVSPEEFIPVCEQTGIIHKLGILVLRQAIEYLKSCAVYNPDSRIMQLAINVSAKQFQRKNFIDEIRNLITESGADASMIELELTESLILDNRDEAMSKLDELKSMGFTLSIDDFGTGYSSLSYISRLPIDKLKIDQTFTQQITQSSKQLAIVETIIVMAENLGMTVIAEGVETFEQVECLRKLRCTEYQGYYFSKPMPIEEYISRINKASFFPSRFAA